MRNMIFVFANIIYYNLITAFIYTDRLHKIMSSNNGLDSVELLFGSQPHTL